MRKTRYSHQLDGSAAVRAAPNGSLPLWMGCRTGKTLTAIDAVDTPALVICPVSVIASWVNELTGDGVDPEQIQVVSKMNQNLLLTHCDWTLINYEKVKKLDALRVREDLPAGAGILPWNTVVADESYRMHNHESGIAEYLLRYKPPAGERRMLLSGSPASENIINFASQYLFLYGSYFGCTSVGEYLHKYFKWNEWSFKWEQRDYSHTAEVRDYVQKSSFCVTMQELGMGCQIFREQVSVTLNEEQQKLLRWLAIAQTYGEQGDEKLFNPLVRVGFEAKIASGVHPLSNEIINNAKQQCVVQMYKDKPQPMLILSRFKAPLYEMQRLLLEKCNLEVDIIHGGTKKEDRELFRLKFQNAEVDIIICQVETIKMGLSFSRLKYIVYLSNSFSCDSRVQSEERGQLANRSESYTILDIVSEGTGDAELVELLRNKEYNSSYYVKRNSEITGEF